jgi:hypothetical protein
MLGLANTISSTSKPAVDRYNGTKSALLDGTDLFYTSSSETAMAMNRVSADSTYSGVGGEPTQMGTLGNPFCTDWSLVTWVKFTNEDALESIFQQAEGADVGIELIKNTDNNLVIRLDDTDITGSTNLSNDTWYHIVVTFNDTTNDCIMYLNGSSEASNTNIDFDGFASTNDTANTYVGYSANPGDRLLGKFYEFAIYDKALSASDVTSFYNGGDVKDLRLHSTVGMPHTWWSFGNVGDYATPAKVYSATHYIGGTNRQYCYGGLLGVSTTFTTDAPSS